MHADRGAGRHVSSSSIFLWFSTLLLDDYAALYSYGKEGATIEQIDRRYAWCKRMIRNYDDTYLSVFPVDWEMPAYVATEFCKMTKQHITKILQSSPTTIHSSSSTSHFCHTSDVLREW